MNPITFKGKPHNLDVRKWNTARETIEELIRDRKAITRKAHTADTGYAQLDLTRLKQQATLLYLIRGACRFSSGHFTHFGPDSRERHLAVMTDLMKCGWTLQMLPLFLTEATTEVTDEPNHPLPPNGASRVGSDQTERLEQVPAAT